MNITIQHPRHRAKYCGCLAAALVGLSLVMAPSVFATIAGVDLGGAADYVVLGVGGSGTFSMSSEKVYQSGVVINGNVGMGPYTSLDHYVDATINGRFDYDLTDSAAQVATQTAGSAISGGVHQINLSSVVADARAASTAAAALPFTQSFSTLTGGQTINGVAGVNVIRVTGAVALDGTLTLSGPAGAQFVFQLTTLATGHIFDVGHLQMVLGSGITAGDILWSLAGTGGDIVLHSMDPGNNEFLYGTILAPERQYVSTHGDLIGSVIAGGSGNLLNIHSDSSMTLPAGTPVPEPTTFLAGALLLLPLGASVIRILRKKTNA